MDRISSAHVVEFARYMSAVYATEYVAKGDSVAMALAASALDSMGILNSQDFLRDYTTTIGRRLFLPFSIGEPSDRFSLWGQIKIITHEHQHVRQLDDDGPVAFAAGYIFDGNERARYEAAAYATAFELSRWAGLALDQPKALAEKLAHYGCSQAQQDYAEGILTSYRNTVESGGWLINAAAASTAIEWLQRNV